MEKLYQGAVNTQNSFVMWAEGPIHVVGRPTVDAATLAGELRRTLNALDTLDSDTRERFQLAARWFTRAIETVNQIDRLIYLWTVLEIYPGEGTADIPRATSELLAAALPKQREHEVAALLGDRGPELDLARRGREVALGVRSVLIGGGQVEPGPATLAQ